MVFQLKDTSLLEQFKPGDHVQFAADKVSGQYTIVRIELVN
jgi:Cu/Ag efflux protein CusF